MNFVGEAIRQTRPCANWWLIYQTGPSTQPLDTWALGISNYTTGFGSVYDSWVLGRLGLLLAGKGCRNGTTQVALGPGKDLEFRALDFGL